MAALHFETLQIASTSSRLAFVVVFLVILLRQPGETCFAVWALALGCSLSASSLMYGDVSSVALDAGKGAAVYALYGASMALSWAGLRLFYERPVLGRWVFLLAVAPGVSYGPLVQCEVPMVMTLSAVFALIALGNSLCIFEILRTPAPDRLWTQYIVLLGFSGYLAVFLASILAILLGQMRPVSSESGIHAMLIDQSCGVFLQVGYLAMASERAQLKFQRLAETDPLTGLANRRGLFATIAGMFGPDRAVPPCAVLLADIDHFKVVNDTHGHEAGDRILVEFTRRLRGAMRAGTLIARWGGEEFLVVLDGVEAADAVGVAERLLAAVSGQPFAIDGRPLRVTTSIGVSITATGEMRIDAAVARADAALYAAKRGGRNRAHLILPADSPAPPEGCPSEPPARFAGAVQALRAGGRVRPNLG